MPVLPIICEDRRAAARVVLEQPELVQFLQARMLSKAKNLVPWTLESLAGKHDEALPDAALEDLLRTTVGHVVQTPLLSA